MITLFTEAVNSTQSSIQYYYRPKYKVWMALAVWLEQTFNSKNPLVLF